MKNLLFKLTPESSFIGELSMLIPRLFFGLSIAFAHGLSKMPPSDQLISGVEALGFPAPSLFAWAASLSEFIGGILLAVGLLTRPAAICLSITMAVAAVGVHGADPYNVKEMALLYLAVFAMFAIRGAGKFSVDNFTK